MLDGTDGTLSNVTGTPTETSRGGAIHVEESSQLRVEDSTVRDSSALYGGCALVEESVVSM